MDRDDRRHGSATLQMTAHSPLRHSVYHSNVSSPVRRFSSKHRAPYTDESSYDTTQSPSRARFQSRTGTHTPPPRLNTEFGRFSHEQFPLNTTRPGTPSRFDSKSSEAGASSLVNPTSALLQGLIKEQRASRGSSRRVVSELAEDITIVTPPSTRSQEETLSEKQRKVNSALSAGLKQPREMGIREMDQYVSKINKLNFDLKLEVFHRAQQVAALEKKLERMQELEEELQRMRGLEDELQELRDVEENNQRLRESNEQLRLELDKRDHAVTEAVELICQLEGRIEEMETGWLDSRPSTARPSTNEGPGEDEPATPQVSTPKAQMVLEIPDRSSSKRGTRIRQTGLRESSLSRKAPSFLRDENKSTTALRSLYSGDDGKYRKAPSVMTRSESWQSSYEASEPDSPRLSALSECSYLKTEDDCAIKQNRYDELDLTPQPAAGKIRLSEGFRSASEEVESKIARIDRWIPPRPDIFQAPTSRGRNRAVSDVSWRAQLSGSENQAGAKSGPKRSDSNYLGVTVFGSGRLPPTPDTMSSSYAGMRNSSNGSIVAEKSRVDQAPLYLRHKLRRPCSADDLTNRPSTAVTGISDSMETTLSETTQQGSSIRTRDNYPRMLPFFGDGSAKVNRLLGPGTPSNPGLTSYAGDIMFNGEGIKGITSEKKNYAPSIHTAISEAPSSPPLTPQDWLDAAKHGPRSRKDGSRKSSKEEAEVMEPTLDPDLLPPTPEHRAGLLARSDSKPTAEEPQLPRNSIRLRGWGSSPANSESQSRRRISLRPLFFNRIRSNSKSLQQSPMSDPIEQGDINDGAPSPVVRKTRYRQPNQDNNSGATARAEEASRELTNKILARPVTESDRPPTSHSGESHHKRRSSSGFFGWMKGKDSQPSSPVTPGRLPRASDRSSSLFSSSRPPSALAITAMEASTVANNETVSPAKAKRLSTGEVDMERRARYLERRARKMAE